MLSMCHAGTVMGTGSLTLATDLFTPFCILIQLSLHILDYLSLITMTLAKKLNSESIFLSVKRKQYG